MDIQGAEFVAMQFPFHKYTFLVMTAKLPKQLVQPLLETNGYVFVKDH